MGIYERGFKHIVILPVTAPQEKEHQSSRPQGLILHEALDAVEGTKAGGKAAEGFDINTLDGQLCEISISHDGDFASAVALVPSPRGDESFDPWPRRIT